MRIGSTSTMNKMILALTISQNSDSKMLLKIVWLLLFLGGSGFGGGSAGKAGSLDERSECMFHVFVLKVHNEL